jgi:hypothetical protein
MTTFSSYAYSHGAADSAELHEQLPLPIPTGFTFPRITDVKLATSYGK